MSAEVCPLPTSRRRKFLVLILLLFCLLPMLMLQVASAGDATPTPVQPTPSTTRSIAFVSDRDGSQQIYLMDTSGDNERLITDFENAVLSDLDWSPDGRYIAYVNSDGPNSDIYVLDVQRLTVRRLTTNLGDDYSPAWSPDGRYIAYTSTRSGPYDVWVMTARGANIRSVTYDPRWEMAVGWTPDGHGITYVPNSGANLQIWVDGWDDSFEWGSPFLFGSPSPGADPVLYSITDFSWSPDDEHLSLLTDYGAYVIDIDGTNLRQIMDRDSYYGGDPPSWSPDSGQIVFASDRDGNAEIYTSDFNGANLQRLTNNTSSDFGPAWRPEAS